MKMVKKIGKKVWNSYCQAMYLAYAPYYMKNENNNH